MSSPTTTPTCAAASTPSLNSTGKAPADATSAKPTASLGREGEDEDDDLEAQLLAALDGEATAGNVKSKPNDTDDLTSAEAAAFIAAASRVKIAPVSQKKKKGKEETEAERKIREDWDAKLLAAQAELLGDAASRHTLGATAPGVPVVDAGGLDVGAAKKEVMSSREGGVTDEAAGKKNVDVKNAAPPMPSKKAEVAPTGAATTPHDTGARTNGPTDTSSQNTQKPFGGLALPKTALPKGHMYPEEIEAAKAVAELSNNNSTPGVKLQGGKLVYDKSIPPELKVAPAAAKRTFNSMVEVVENGVTVAPRAMITEYSGIDGVSAGLKEAKMGFPNLKMKVVRHANGAIDIVISGSHQPAESTTLTPAAPSRKRKQADEAENSGKRMKKMEGSQGVNGVSTSTPDTIDLTNDDDGAHPVMNRPQVPVTPTAATKRKRGTDDDGDVSNEAGTGGDAPQMKKHRAGQSSYTGENSSSGEGLNGCTAGGNNQNAIVDLTGADSSNSAMPPPPRPVKPALSRTGGQGVGTKPAIGMNMQGSHHSTEEEFAEGGFKVGHGLKCNHLSDGQQPAGKPGQYTGDQLGRPGSTFDQSFAESRGSMLEEWRQAYKFGKNPSKYDPNALRC